MADSGTACCLQYLYDFCVVRVSEIATDEGFHVRYAALCGNWGIALLEYSCQVPANRIGYEGNGGAFSLMQLKVIQEAITLVVFTVFTVVFFRGETLQWNHFAAFVCLILAVYFVFMK